jgi:WD40 repeat protein
MSPRSKTLLLQVLLFVMVTLLALATGYLTSGVGRGWGLGVVQRWAAPLAAALFVGCLGLLVWQHRVDSGSALLRPEWDSDRSPYPGLEAFGEDDAGVFFGREAEVAALVERLNPALPAGPEQRLVTVVGPSGVGKSSLIHAGLLPQLRRRREGWVVVPVVVPGDRPVARLARVLEAAVPGSPAAGAGSGRGAAAFGGMVDRLRPVRGGSPATVVIVVDQAEELITLCSPDDQAEFLGLLAAMLARDSRLWVVLVARSEFLTALLETKSAHLFGEPSTVGVLGPAALLEVVERPAAKAGLRFDPPSLVQRIVADTGAGSALPLLAYTMLQLHATAGQRGVMTLAAYERLGGVTGVLTRHADRVVAELRAADPDCPVEATLMKFVAFTENQPTRRPVRRGGLSQQERQVVDGFIAARLLTVAKPSDGGPASEGDSVIEVAHEALFRYWAPLRQEIEAHADALRWRADLERWARDWERSGRQDSYLLRAERLIAAQRAAAILEVSAEPLLEEFLDESRRADAAIMANLSETLARQALAGLEQDPEHSLRLALAAYEECQPTSLARCALAAALAVSRVRMVLRGHEGAVWGIAWSPDGTRLLSGGIDGTVRIWDAATGLQQAVLRGHVDRVRAVAWSPDGTRIASAAEDGTVLVRDPERPATRPVVLRGHERRLRAVAWSPDSQRLVTAAEDHTARIWDAVAGAQLLTLDHDDNVLAVAWSPDGRRIATACADRTVRLWDADRGDMRAVLDGHAGAVWAVAWSPDGRRLASGSIDCTARVWPAGRPVGVAVLRGHDSWLAGVTWSPDGRQLATGSDDRTVRIWATGRVKDQAGRTADLAPPAGRCLAVLRGHEDGVRAITWSPNGQRIATGAYDSTIRIWDAPAADSIILRGHDDQVETIAWATDGRHLATGSTDRTIRIWNPDQGNQLTLLRGHEDRVCSVRFAPDCRRLASGSYDCTVRIWDTDGTAEPTALTGHTSTVFAVAWAPDGRRLASSGNDRTVRIWEPGRATQPTVLPEIGTSARAVAWSPDGRYLALGCYDHLVRIWDTTTGTRSALLSGPTGPVGAVAWSLDGQRLAAAANDHTVHIWQPASRTPPAVLRGHTDMVRTVSWSPDGHHLATGGLDRTIRIWDADQRTELVVLAVLPGWINSVSYAPDGHHLAVACADRTARILDASTRIDDQLHAAHSRVLAPLTDDQRRTLLLPHRPAAQTLPTPSPA